MSVTIYHNPRCSKSRQTLQLLQERGVELEIIEYLKNPLSADEIKNILKMLNKTIGEITRKGEKEFKEQNLGDGTKSDEDLIAAMAATPKLMERPIVINGTKAALGRPPESVLDIL